MHLLSNGPCYVEKRREQFSLLDYILKRVIRPKGGINKWLQWLPVSLHKRLENVRKLIYGDSLSTQIAVRGHKLMSLAGQGILEANAKHIATLSCEAFAKYVLFNIFMFFYVVHPCVFHGPNDVFQAISRAVLKQ